MDKAKPLIEFSALRLLSCFDTDGWLTERTSTPADKKAYHLCPKVLLLKQYKTKLRVTSYNNNNDRLTAFDPGQPG